jgi:hypothetical protein
MKFAFHTPRFAFPPPVFPFMPLEKKFDKRGPNFFLIKPPELFF